MPNIPWFGTTRERGWMDPVLNLARVALSQLRFRHGMASLMP